MRFLDDAKHLFQSYPPRIYNVEDVSSNPGWLERFDGCGRVVRLEFNCAECTRGANWCHPRLEPLCGEFAFTHCGRTDHYVVGEKLPPAPAIGSGSLKIAPAEFRPSFRRGNALDEDLRK